jgi:hypothetical protein
MKYCRILLKCIFRVTLPSRNTNEILSTVDCDCNHFSNNSMAIEGIGAGSSRGAIAKTNVSNNGLHYEFNNETNMVIIF